MKKQLAFLALGLVLVLVLSAQLARAGTQGGVVPNDFGPVWSPDARTIAFTHEPPERNVHWDEARTVPAGHGGEQHIGFGIVRAWQSVYDGIVTELEGQTWIFGFTSHPPFVDGVDASPSPDGLHVAYSARTGSRATTATTGSSPARETTRSSAGPGNDVLDAGAGNDLVEGGPGRDTLDAGPGDDTVEARDGFRDVIDCGPGRDRAEIDRLDVVRNCERVLRP